MRRRVGRGQRLKPCGGRMGSGARPCTSRWGAGPSPPHLSPSWWTGKAISTLCMRCGRGWSCKIWWPNTFFFRRERLQWRQRPKPRPKAKGGRAEHATPPQHEPRNPAQTRTGTRTTECYGAHTQAGSTQETTAATDGHNNDRRRCTPQRTEATRARTKPKESKKSTHNPDPPDGADLSTDPKFLALLCQHSPASQTKGAPGARGGEGEKEAGQQAKPSPCSGAQVHTHPPSHPPTREQQATARTTPRQARADEKSHRPPPAAVLTHEGKPGPTARQVPTSPQARLQRLRWSSHRMLVIQVDV